MRVLIADAEVFFRAGIRHLLQQLDSGVDVVEAGNADEALGCIGEAPSLNLILIDPMGPRMQGETIWLERLRMLVTRAPAEPIVVITASESPSDIRRALEVGVAGYIPKTAKTGTMLSALKLVLAGEIYVPPSLARRSSYVAGMPASGPVGADERSLTIPLTRRQHQVLALLGEGKANKDIADELGISERTVGNHVASILKLLGVSNRTQAAVAAVEMRFAESITARLPPFLPAFESCLSERRNLSAVSLESSMPERRPPAAGADDPTSRELKRLWTPFN